MRPQTPTPSNAQRELHLHSLWMVRVDTGVLPEPSARRVRRLLTGALRDRTTRQK